jgi:hypothetical protein
MAESPVKRAEMPINLMGSTGVIGEQVGILIQISSVQAQRARRRREAP